MAKLFLFNPTCEMAVVNGSPSYMPPAHLRGFEQDLSLIPMWLASEDDAILLNEEPPTDFISTINNWGVSTPQFITYDKLADYDLHPWGWSPAVHKILAPFKHEGSNNPMSEWKPEHKRLLSRFTGLDLINAIFDDAASLENIEIPQIPVEITSLEHLAQLEANMSSPILLKTLWSASGRGLFKIRSRAEEAASNAWVISRLKQQGALLAEPFLEKVRDVSFHFWSSAEGLEYRGLSIFETDAAGRFMGCYIRQEPDSSLHDFPFQKSIEQAVELLQKGLEAIRLRDKYHGPIGIDGILFKNKAGKIKLHPAIEINLRYSMGLVNLRLASYIAPSSSGYWLIKKLKAGEWKSMEEQNPPLTKDVRLCSGVFPLTPPPLIEGYMAFLNLQEASVKKHSR